MRSECIQAVNRALGRSSTQAETRDIENQLRSAMRQGARTDPQWASYTDAERASKAADLVAKQLEARAAKKRQRLAQAILASDRVESYVKAQAAAGVDSNPFQSLHRLIENNVDGKSNVLSMEARRIGIMSDFWRQLAPNLKLVKPIFLTLVRNKAAERTMWRAMAGDADVPPEYARAADALHSVFTAMKDRYNRAGGDVGTLDNWDLPHEYSRGKALDAGKQAFVERQLGRIDRSRYVNEDGAPMNDAQMREFLGHAWTTIATDGANKLDGNVGFGNGIKANRFNQSRQLHYKDGQSTIDAMRDFSDVGFLEAVNKHAQALSKQIALIEQFGPNPDALMKSKINAYAGQIAKDDPVAWSKIEKFANKVQDLYNYAAGNTHTPPVNEKLAGAMATIRNYETGVLTASAGITRLGDNATLYPTSVMNGLSPFKVFKNQLLHFASGEQRDLARRMGLMLQTQMDTMNRFATENLGSTWSRQFSAFMLRTSGHNLVAEANQNAFSMTALDALGKMTREIPNIADVAVNDGRWMRAAGVTQKTWDIWKMADLDAGRGNDTLLTAEGIYKIPPEKLAAAFPGENPTVLKEQAATTLLGALRSEEGNAVMEPGYQEHMQMAKAKGAPGTIMGELGRSALMFKSYPLAMFNRQILGSWKRYEGMGRVGYIASVLAGTVVMGAIANWLKDIVAGRDPRSLDASTDIGRKNLLAAIMKGGGLGVYGDFIFDNRTSYGAQLGDMALGPVGKGVADIADLTLGYGKSLYAHPEQSDKINQQEQEKAVRFIKGNFPGMNAWYAKAVLDHLIFQNLNDYVAPGLNERMNARAQRLYGTTYWWQPDEAVPQRTPQFQDMAP